MFLVRWIAVSFVMRQRCLPHIGMFSFLHRQCINLYEGCLRNKMYLHSILKGCFFALKDFDQSQELKTIAKKSLSQSEVSTDNRKVSTFFAFHHVRCRCCYRSHLDRFLISAWRFVPNTEVVSGEHIRHFLPFIVCFFFLHGALLRRNFPVSF